MENKSLMDRRRLLKIGAVSLGVYAVGVGGLAGEIYARNRGEARQERTDKALSQFQDLVGGVKFNGDPVKDAESVRTVMNAVAITYSERFKLPLSYEPYGIPVGLKPRWGETMQPNILDYPRAGGQLVTFLDGKPGVGTISFYVGSGKTLPNIDQDKVAIWTIVNQYVRRQASLNVSEERVDFGLRHFGRTSEVETGAVLDGAAANVITAHLVGKEIERAALVASEDVYAPVINRLEMNGALGLGEVLEKCGLTIGWLEEVRRSSDAKRFADELVRRITQGGVRGYVYRPTLEGNRPWDMKTADDLILISNQLRERDIWRRLPDRIVAK